MLTIKRLAPGEIMRWKAHTDAVQHLALLPTAKHSLRVLRTERFGCGTRKVASWCIRSRATGKKWSPWLSALTGKVLASGSLDKTANWWDVASGKLLGTSVHTAVVWAVAFAADGKSLFTGAWDGTLAAWTWIPARTRCLQASPRAFVPWHDTKKLWCWAPGTSRWCAFGTLTLESRRKPSP